MSDRWSTRYWSISNNLLDLVLLLKPLQLFGSPSQMCCTYIVGAVNHMKLWLSGHGKQYLVELLERQNTFIEKKTNFAQIFARLVSSWLYTPIPTLLGCYLTDVEVYFLVIHSIKVVSNTEHLLTYHILGNNLWPCLYCQLVIDSPPFLLYWHTFSTSTMLWEAADR